MLKNLFSLYHYKYPNALVSLMSSSSYQPTKYLKLLHKTNNFLQVKKYSSKNKKSLLALIILSLGMILQVAGGIVLIVLGAGHHFAGGIFFGIALILLYPFTWAYLLALGLVLRNRNIATSLTLEQPSEK